MRKNAEIQQKNATPSEQKQKKSTFIFLDEYGQRWPKFRFVTLISCALAFIAIVLFVETLLVPPSLTLPPSVMQLKSRLKGLDFKNYLNRQAVSKPLWIDFAKRKKESHMTANPSSERKRNQLTIAKKGNLLKSEERGIRLGFYESWDPDSLDSLKAHAEKLTHICPDWLTIDDGYGNIKVTAHDDVLAIAKHSKLTVLPLLRNLGTPDIWLTDAVEGLINGPKDRQEKFYARLKEILQKMGAGGMVLDWGQLDPSYRNNMTSFLNGLADSLHDASLELWVCIPVGKEIDIYDLDNLAQHVDRFIALLHDENAESDNPGPIASKDYFSGWLKALVESYGDPAQWVISIASYGYDWQEGQSKAERLSFQDVMGRAGRSSLITCEFDAPSYNPHFVYEDSSVVHTVWFLDVITFYNQLAAARELNVGGIAVSSLGTEDPDIWEVLDLDTKKPLASGIIKELELISSGDAIANIGQGNLLTINSERTDGFRKITYDPNAGSELPLTANYEKFPNYLTVSHQGKGEADMVALTFDDGPDPEWTPKLLDILKEKGAKATFFMIGANMEKHPELVRRIVREGHLAGLHTYSHPNIAEVSEERTRLEFNATQRLLESITDRSSILFRPPYNADTHPHEPEELVPVQIANKMGYITITEDIDTEDWDLPGVSTIVDRVTEGRQYGGNVVLLHDAGGNREQTVKALPELIDYLRNRGDRIVPLSEMIGISDNQLMPAIEHNQRSIVRIISESGFVTIHTLTKFFWAFMIVATFLTLCKTLIISWLAFKDRKKAGSSERPQEDQFCPPVSVLMAAYNEEKVIKATLQSILQSNYPGTIEIVVVDDGSKDDTAGVVNELARDDQRIRLIQQENRGKAIALQAGLEAVSHDIIISLDADTLFERSTISNLVQPLKDDKVGAVSGRARVGNPKSLFARFQSLEYTCGFNLDRRAYNQLDCITVVPGAVSAFRKQAIHDAGGISTDTLAEDTDLTLALHKCDYVVAYSPNAVAWTEAPETMKAFARQRFRWAFGTLQCLWKHRDLLFAFKYKALGWFSLPSAWFFNIFLVAIGSIIDILLLCSLFISPANGILYFYFLIFVVADLVLAAVACLVEKEPLQQIWLILPMRFIYRPVLNYVVVKALLKAVKGVWVGWGKLDRTASVASKFTSV